MYEDDMDLYFDMPGGDDFEDVTELFDVAASDMTSGQVILTDGFTLLDGMSAFEIGEPRMDSGMIHEQVRKPPFDPLTPLLPQELCWILDRSFACEMEWHAGNTLSQTVYTLLYVHSLPQIDPELIQYPTNGQALRAFEGMITIALRSAVIGLLKCCDLTWRELSKGKVHDTEDWQGEKCDISLLEGTPVEYSIRILEEGCLWLQSSSLTTEDKSMLVDRLLLRKSILELFRLRLPADLTRLGPLIVMTRSVLRRIRSRPNIPSPASTSRALDAFDPHITRRLHNFLPIRIVQLPSQTATWDSIDCLLQGWEILDHLLSSHSIFAWDVSGTICTTFHKTLPPYIRSLIQSALQDRNHVFGVYPNLWLVEHYFSETLGISYEAITHTMRVHWDSTGTFSTKELERQVLTPLVNHLRSHWYSPPRRRRYLMTSVVEWQIVQDGFRSLASQLIIEDDDTDAIINAFLATPCLWKTSTAREIILSGFQQELYASEEIPVAYWYTAEVLKIHLSLLDILKEAVPEDTHAHAELQFQTAYLSGLQLMCLAVCALSYRHVTLSDERMALNFRRRYKWLFTQVFPNNEEQLILPVPKFEEFVPSVTELLSSPAQDRLTSAKEHLLQAVAVDTRDFISPSQATERLTYVRQLIDFCDQLATAENGQLRWNPSIHPWFPVVSSTSTTSMRNK